LWRKVTLKGKGVWGGRKKLTWGQGGGGGSSQARVGFRFKTKSLGGMNLCLVVSRSGGGEKKSVTRNYVMNGPDALSGRGTTRRKMTPKETPLSKANLLEFNHSFGLGRTRGRATKNLHSVIKLGGRSGNGSIAQNYRGIGQ